MNSKFSPIGKLVQLVDNRNIDCKVKLLLGMNIKKEFMPSVANTINTDLSKYKVIKKDQFCYSPMQTGRDETIRVALYKDESAAVISPAYSVFEVIDTSIVIAEFIMIYFLRAESDRYGWFISDGSVRASLDWERFCEIEIPLPSLETQKNYVKIYKAIIAKQKVYKDSLDSLKFICDSFVENQILTGNKKRLESYIVQSDLKNYDLSTSYLRGISTAKKLIESKANTNGVDFSKYRVVKANEFAYVADTSRRGDKIAIAMNQEGKSCIVSAIYTVFEVKKDSGLLPEYLYLWFSRKEFDRYARYHSWGSARETFDWKSMCDVELPIPTIEEQKAIIAIHNVLEERKKIYQQLQSSIQPLCPVLIRGVLQELNLESVK
ncbi:restriction endonuclease subunit S [Vibrio algicola]|uniref:Restriction endonuclease subunit S n=1 Tax=Vibrio algicola TaxID=2662262 RepID=A0A5Q0TG80_9VIBR|nr:restriction endonuclease subunit S [Vibrio algicola]